MLNHINGGGILPPHQTDLFTYTPKPSYPYSAGHRRIDTSIEAAVKVDSQPSRKEQCYAEIMMHLRKRGSFGATTSELAETISGYSYEYLQPRTSEMQKLGMIIYDGQRRKNSKGSTERVWVII